MVNRKNINNLFLIEKLLKNVRGAKSQLARELKITPTAICKFFKTWARTIWKQREYTNAFNKCFESNFSYKELFNLVDKN